MQDTVMMMTMQGDELKALRKRLGESQEGMAAALGMSKKFIGMMERDEAPIERRTAMAAIAYEDWMDADAAIGLAIKALHQAPPEMKPIVKELYDNLSARWSRAMMVFGEAGNSEQ